MRRTKSTGFAAITLLTFCAVHASACECAVGTPPCQGYWDADAVFSGVVTQISPISYEVTEFGRTRTERMNVVRFTVEASYMGHQPEEAEVSTGSGCGFPFRRGEHYLVYATLNEKTKKLETSICMLTKPLEQAKEDLEYIHGLVDSPPGVRLYGQVRDWTRDASGHLSGNRLAGVDIRVKGPNGEHDIVSDRDGRYELNGLPPGRYQIHAALLNYIGAGRKDPEFDLRSHGCMKWDLLLQLNGQISGRVFDAHGNPVPNQTVELADENGNGLEESRTETDDQGFYRFTGVRPGNFFIGVNLSDPPNLKHPYVRTFFPNVHQREAAAIVHLPAAATLRGQDIYVSTICETRTLQGAVFWPDGTPAKNATITLVYPEYPWRSDSAAGPDAQGKFSVQVLTNLRTILWVQAPNSAGVWMNAGQRELPTEGPLKPVVLILSFQPELPADH